MEPEENQNKGASSVDENKVKIAHLFDTFDPPWLDPETIAKLDRISLADLTSEKSISPGQIMENRPSFDDSSTAQHMRSIIFGDDNKLPGMNEIKAKLLKMKAPAPNERLEVKDYATKTQSLKAKYEQLYSDLCSLAKEYFEKDPTFLVHRNPEVTIACILYRIGVPGEVPEPDEYINPDRRGSPSKPI